MGNMASFETIVMFTHKGMAGTGHTSDDDTKLYFAVFFMNETLIIIGVFPLITHYT